MKMFGEELSLEVIRNKEIEILNHLDEFCKENGIRYYLSNGTLLGAVKYKGFIPWDDDVDVVLLRKDYDRLVSLYKDSKYILLESSRVRGFKYPFAKLSDSETVLCEKGVNNGVELGVNIDVFPLDFAGSDYSRAKKIANSSHRLSMLLIFAKSKININPDYSFLKNLFFMIIGMVAKLLPESVYIECINALSLMHRNQESSKYISSLTWSVYKGREVVRTELFKNSVEVDFEGKKYPAPEGYDEYLRSLYGDYEADPPKDKQVSHHSFVAYKK